MPHMIPGGAHHPIPKNQKDKSGHMPQYPFDFRGGLETLNSPFLVGPPMPPMPNKGKDQIQAFEEPPKQQKLIPQKIKTKSVLIDAINNTKSGVSNKADEIIKVRQPSEEEKEEVKSSNVKVEKKEQT